MVSAMGQFWRILCVGDTYVGVDNRASSPALLILPITAGDQ